MSTTETIASKKMCELVRALEPVCLKDILTGKRAIQYIVPFQTSAIPAWSGEITDPYAQNLSIIIFRSQLHNTRDDSVGNMVKQIESDTEDIADEILQPYLNSLQPIPQEETTFDMATRLIPPTMPQRRFKVRIRFTGKEEPRIKYDPESE